MAMWLRGKNALLWVVLLAFAGADAPPTSRPTTAPDETTRTRDVFGTLLQQGTNALAAREYPAALEALLDAKQIFEKRMRGKTAAVGSPEHVALMHGLALAYQL